MITASVAELIESFFLERLLSQQQASRHTMLSYRDTFRLLFQYLNRQLKKPPSKLKIDDLSAQHILHFLADLEKTRSCSVRSRNQRLAAIRSFFRYLSYKTPERSALIQQVLAIPNKRHERVLIDYLNRIEVEAILKAPDQQTWLGRRDHLLLSIALQTGFRLSELTGLCWNSVHFGNGAHIRVTGKGRKERSIPLTRELASQLESWRRSDAVLPTSPIFPTRNGTRLSSDAFQRLIRKYVIVAKKKCPSLNKKRVSPHVLRHSTAMHLLQSGVGQSVIALWLGHESIETTQMYLSADLKMKEQVLKNTTPLKNRYSRYQPGDRLLAFLESI